jgi:hypothetical protein
MNGDAVDWSSLEMRSDREREAASTIAGLQATVAALSRTRTSAESEGGTAAAQSFFVAPNGEIVDTLAGVHLP